MKPPGENNQTPQPTNCIDKEQEQNIINCEAKDFFMSILCIFQDTNVMLMFQQLRQPCCYVCEHQFIGSVSDTTSLPLPHLIDSRHQMQYSLRN